MRPFSGAEWIGDPDHGGILLLSDEQLPNGSWLRRYSVAPGAVAQLVVAPGPGMLPANDLAYLEVIRGTRISTPNAPGLPALPDPGLP